MFFEIERPWSKLFHLFSSALYIAKILNSNVKAIKKLSETELRLGLDTKKSWHEMYEGSAYIFVGKFVFNVMLDATSCMYILSFPTRFVFSCCRCILVFCECPKG